MHKYKYPELESVCLNLRKYRKQRQLTQADLANRCGCHRTYISALERGRINPTILTLTRLSKELEIDLCYLLIDTKRMG